MNAPTLLVGLGGCGCQMISYVADLVTDEQRKNIEFVAIDTDINELRGIRENNPFVRSIQISSRLTVGEYLEINQHARDTWFPVNRMLNSKVLSEGAGQVRAISRLAFEAAVREDKMKPLHDAIDSLYKVEMKAQPQALRVIIASSLAGGTGSGIIVPVGLYIKNYISTHFRQSATITRGFFMLPEIFYGVIPGASGKNNLRCNAYATLRELDAFLMKGDNTLPEKYMSSVKMDFPRPDTDTFENFTVRPYDFCFLYDAQNTSGTKFDPADKDVYVKHAASCIYAQSIGPMNVRSNSSEDNTILRITAERGRNRYAGAGSSMLIYPVDDIKKYIGLSWTKKLVTESWLSYDHAYKERLEKDERDRANGIPVQSPKLEDFYPLYVEKNADANDPLAKAIVSSCVSKSADGIHITGQKWDVYVDALLAKIAKDEDDDAQVILADYKDKAQKAIAGITGEDNAITKKSSAWVEYAAAYDKMKSYRSVTENHVEEVARITADSLFWTPKDDVFASQEPHNLVTHLKDVSGHFLHPCAMRYLLYKIKQRLAVEKTELDAKVNGEKSGYTDFMKTLEEGLFDDKTTKDTIEKVDDLKDREVGFKEKITQELTAEQKSLKKKYNTYMNRVSEYRVDAIQLRTVETAIDYVNGLVDAFSLFFDKLDARISGVDREIAAIEKRYVNKDGRSVRFVCASPDCLAAMRDRYSITGGGLEINSDLSGDIYKKVYAYASDKKKTKPDKYFDEVFDKGIVGYYVDLVKTKYGTGHLDVNVLEAIENECRYLEEDGEKPEVLRQYVIDTITETRNLSVPYIETPLGVGKETIYACTYGMNLKFEDDDYSDLANVARDYLVEFGGKADDSLGAKDKPGENNRIVFYQAVYGLRANELSKFAPPCNTKTTVRNGGEYYKAYFERIGKLNPDSDRSLGITPHTDRWWHIASKMPDIDEGNQQQQEEAINAAFLWSLLGGYVRYNSGASEKNQYNLADDLGTESQCNLTVSNGSNCDQLYELLDALSIYPELVQRINDQVREQIAEDTENTGIDPISEGFLARQLKDFTVDQFELGNGDPRSIFELPLLIRRSVKGLNYTGSEDNAISVLRTSLNELRKYVSCIANEDEAIEDTGDIIEEQFDLFLKNVEREKDCYRNIYGSNFFIRICRIIARFTKEMGLVKLGNSISSKADEAIKASKSSVNNENGTVE